jgi:predicted glycoside hydrolase/deacetylase ChbG (UPF0249 family)
MTGARCLIVNADDFGQSPGVNRGIIRAHEHGIVTSASLMVRPTAAAEAAAYARAHPGLGVGLHVDLGEWAYAGGAWEPLYEVAPLEDAGAVAAAVGAQLSTFRDLVGADPTHLDSHQHVHRRAPVHGVLTAIARRLGVPLRHDTAGVRYCGEFYGQEADGRSLPGAVGIDALLRILAALPPGVTELACHPAEGDDLETMYRAERALELRALCDPRARAALVASGIRLVSFRSPDVARARLCEWEEVECVS